MAVWMSAATGVGLPELLEAVVELLPGGLIDCQLALHPGLASLRAALYNLGAVTAEKEGLNGDMVLDLRIDPVARARLLKKFGTTIEALSMDVKKSV